jgi:hypothetical protein
VLQEDIVQEAEVGASRKVFDLELPELGPYNIAFTRSGRHMALGGRKGHLAIMEWQQRHLVCEVQVQYPRWSYMQQHKWPLCCQPVHLHQHCLAFEPVRISGTVFTGVVKIMQRSNAEVLA